MTLLTSTLCFISSVILMKDAIKSERRKLCVLSSILLLLFGIIYALIFLIEVFLK